MDFFIIARIDIALCAPSHDESGRSKLLAGMAAVTLLTGSGVGSFAQAAKNYLLTITATRAGLQHIIRGHHLLASAIRLPAAQYHRTEWTK